METGHNTPNYRDQGGKTWTIGGVLELLAGASMVEQPSVLSGAADAIPVNVGTIYMVTTAGVDAMTLAAPVAGGPGVGNDGVIIYIVSAGAHAHTITSTGNFNTGAAAVNEVTFAAHAGASVLIMAYNGAWYVLASNAASFS
jgi:hypothetical protein